MADMGGLNNEVGFSAWVAFASFGHRDRGVCHGHGFMRHGSDAGISFVNRIR
jgi:hypothetical protein